MKKLIEDVAAFHRATGLPVVTTPTYHPERVDLRVSLLLEEAQETCAAMIAGDMDEIADGIADTIYVAIGAALEFGIPLERVWAEVQRSNMAKVDPVTGKVVRREDGKILKPEGWTAPDIAGVLAGRL